MTEQAIRFLGDYVAASDGLKCRFAETNCVQIRDFLSPNFARELAAHLTGRNDWRHVINGASQVFETPADQFDLMSPAERMRLDQAVFTAATEGFQFRYDTIRVADERDKRLASGTILDQFSLSLNTDACLNFFGDVSDRRDLKFADVQATRYRAGDFLTRHDDDVAGKDRALAYVLGLTENWKAEWGGLLLFNDPDGDVAQALVPRFNTLTLFTVGQPHSVSYVAPYAGAPRISITGWLRTSSPE